MSGLFLFFFFFLKCSINNGRVLGVLVLLLHYIYSYLTHISVQRLCSPSSAHFWLDLMFINCKAKPGCTDGRCSRGRKEPVNKATEWDAFCWTAHIKARPVNSCIQALITFCSPSVILAWVHFGVMWRLLKRNWTLAEAGFHSSVYEQLLSFCSLLHWEAHTLAHPRPHTLT